MTNKVNKVKIGKKKTKVPTVEIPYMYIGKRNLFVLYFDFMTLYYSIVILMIVGFCPSVHLNFIHVS